MLQIIALVNTYGRSEWTACVSCLIWLTRPDSCQIGINTVDVYKTQRFAYPVI